MASWFALAHDDAVSHRVRLSSAERRRTDERGSTRTTRARRCRGAPEMSPGPRRNLIADHHANGARARRGRHRGVTTRSPMTTPYRPAVDAGHETLRPRFSCGGAAAGCAGREPRPGRTRTSSSSRPGVARPPAQGAPPPALPALPPTGPVNSGKGLPDGRRNWPPRMPGTARPSTAAAIHEAGGSVVAGEIRRRRASGAGGGCTVRRRVRSPRRPGAFDLVARAPRGRVRLLQAGWWARSR